MIARCFSGARSRRLEGVPDLSSYLFNLEPGAADTLIYVLGVFFAVAFGAGLVVYRQHKKRFRGSPYLWLAGSAGLWGAIIGGLGLLFTLAAVAGTPVLSARFWTVGLAFVGFALIVWLLYVVFVRIPRDRARYYQFAERQRYLPRPSAKKKSKGRKR
jgi:hypothetical protein